MVSIITVNGFSKRYPCNLARFPARHSSLKQGHRFARAFDGRDFQSAFV